MTYEEAVNTINIAIDEVEWNYPMDYAIAFEKAKETLEKQIPKKLIYIKKLTYSKQTKCFNGHNIPVQCKNGKMPYCPFCGQKLDWSDTQ